MEGPCQAASQHKQELMKMGKLTNKNKAIDQIQPSGSFTTRSVGYVLNPGF